ncbi:hypothetical protein FHS38_004411 [Streptomyces netropsis]|uniref:Uncharacterized protein n=1 Tax=Streptomyces netropsis TaxID=55404 RepID=A0A7W7LDR5_STRNE|nr:hypothetical protein [Streptomyces netropsis]
MSGVDLARVALRAAMEGLAGGLDPVRRAGRA